MTGKSKGVLKFLQHQRFWIPLLLIGLLLAAAATDPVHDAMAAVLDAARQFIRHHEVLGLTLFIALSALSAMLFFFSTAVIVPVAVHTWGKPWTMLLLWGSWLLGAMLSYWVGLKPGRRLVKWMMPARRIAKYEKTLSADSNFSLVLLFQLAVPSEIPGYLLGALRYHFGRYLSARALAELPFAIGAVYLGDTFVRRQYGPLIAISVGGVLLSAAALYFLQKRLGAKST